MLVGEIVGFVGDIDCDSRKPDGVPGKLVDTAKLNSLGWQAKISLRDGIQQTYQWCLENSNIVQHYWRV